MMLMARMWQNNGRKYQNKNFKNERDTKMSKVFVKHTFDMNDADYVYGCQIVGKEEWENFKKWAEKKETIWVYHNNDETERLFSEIEITVTEITEEQEQLLTKLGLSNFGMDIPGMYEYRDYLWDLGRGKGEE